MRVIVALITLTLAWPASAAADFVARPSPALPDTVIVGFAVSGPHQVALLSRTSGLSRLYARVSHDDGDTWGPATIAGLAEAPTYSATVTTGPDGAFWTATNVTERGAATVMRMPADGSDFAVAGPPLPDSDGFSAMRAGPVWDREGRIWAMWPAASQPSVSQIARLSSGGAVTAAWTVPAVGLRLTEGGDGALYADGGGGTWRLTDAGPLPVGAIALASEGGFAVSSRRASYGGGAHAEDLATDPVDGAPGLLLRDGLVYERFSAEVWRPVLVAADSTWRVLAAGGSLYAVGYTDLSRHTGPLPAGPASAPLPSQAQAMLDEANRLRAGASLPPLVADAGISQAAANHSRYWTLNRPSANLGLGYHNETRGRPGFTGTSMTERCAAVGAQCSSEIMYPGQTGADAARGWIATIYHRTLVMSPAAHIVGAGLVDDGPAVMNGTGAAAYWQVAPIGYPRGLYDGDLGFSGEIPDPGAACKRRRVAERITEPYGAAVTLFAPADATAKMTEVVPDGGRPLAGCRLDEAFVPDDSLLPGTTYTANGTWGEPPQPFSWTFRTAGTAPRGSRCRPRIRLRLRRARLSVTYRACAPGRLVVQARRPGARRPKVRRSRSLRRGGSSGRLIVRLDAGRWRVSAKLTGARRKSVSRTLRVHR